MAKFSVRRIRNEEERYQGGSTDFVSLKEVGDKFLGTALFLGDPTMDEPGYFEFFQHYIPGPVGYFPCAGDDCPLCEEGDKPSTRALSLWYDPATESVKMWEMNGYSIRDLSEMRSENEKIMGRTFRITRVDDKGKYLLFPKDVTLNKTQVKEALADAVDLEDWMDNKLARKMEQWGVSKALTEDDDQPARRVSGKPKPQIEESEEPEAVSDDGQLQGTYTILRINKAKETLILADNDGEEITLYGVEVVDDEGNPIFEKGVSVDVTASQDSDGDWVAESVATRETASESVAEGEVPAEVDEMAFVVTKVNMDKETLDLENDDFGIAFELFFQEAAEYGGVGVDLEDYSEGMKILVSAVKDQDGDMVATVIPTAVKARRAVKK